ncbi:hypothetical protein DUNSADRAFT_11232, partial [Dunaliella salina]
MVSYFHRKIGVNHFSVRIHFSCLLVRAGARIPCKHTPSSASQTQPTPLWAQSLCCLCPLEGRDNPSSHKFHGLQKPELRNQPPPFQHVLGPISSVACACWLGGARIPSKHSSSSASQATPAGPQSNSSAAPLSHAKGSTEEAGQKHPHQHEQQQQQQQQRQSDGPSSSSLCPPSQNQGPSGPDVKGSGKRGVDECVDAEDGELRAGKVARRDVVHPNNGSTPSAAAGVTTASNGLAAACLTSNGVGCNGGAHGNTAGGVSTGGRGAQQQGGGQGAQPQVQQQQQQSQRPMLAKQQSMLPALMGSDPLAQLQQICAERGLRMKLREAPVPHNFDPQTDPRVSVEDAASVAAAAAKAAEVAREMMLLQQEIDNEEGCIGDRAMEGGLNGSTNQGDPRSQDEDLANRQVLAASQWVCVEGSVMDLSGYKVLALASAITPQKDKARRQAAFCMLRDILQQHPEFLPSGSTAPLTSRHRKQQDQGSKGGQTAKAPAPKERPSSSSRPPPLSNQTRSVNPRHQSQLPHYPQQGHGHSHRLSSSHSQGSAERSQPHLPHPHSSAERPAPQQWRPFKPGSAPYGGAVHPTPNSLMLTDMSGSGIPLEVVHLLDSCNKDGGCPSAAELVNGYCIRERARAVFVESPTLPGMQGFFGCDAMMQSNPTNPGERPAVLFGPATGYVRHKIVSDL